MFGKIQNQFGTEFINLYSVENPILNVDDICYFLMINNKDYHLPIRCKGIVMQDKFIEGMNKIYYVKILEIIENPKTINTKVLNNQYELFKIENFKILSKKLYTIINIKDFNDKLYLCDAFFVRKEFKEIDLLRDEYISEIKKDLLQQIKEIDDSLVVPK
jgi:hypothetical protein